MAKTSLKTDAKRSFLKQLDDQQKLINADILAYCSAFNKDIGRRYGDYSAEAAAAFTGLLGRGGKRIRGSLVMSSYKMFGGTNESMILQAARAVEMLHAYILMIDDINDRSVMRRGAPAAHIALKEFHERHHLKDGSQHFGEAIAMNAALLGAHQAQIIMSQLDVEPEKRLAALTNLNSCLSVTVHGQFNDLFNEVVETVDRGAVENVLLWKTAYYTFMNPLQLGAILAGANGNTLELIRDYSLHAGRVFQITDDILGIFGEQFESGKSPLDDLREGKRTLLTIYALDNAPKPDAYFLETMMGNRKLTMAEFNRCREIIASSGALQFARDEAKTSADKARAVLKNSAQSWEGQGVAFLDGLVQFLVDRRR